MKKFFLIGSGIQGSLSPLIHNFIYNEYSIDAEYAVLDIKDLSVLSGINADGFNITRPFKQTILPLLTTDYSGCKSVNTVKVTAGGFDGYSTDGQGFLLDAKRLMLDLSRVLVLGAGGAARAVCYALKNEARQVFVFNRTGKRAKALAEETEGRYCESITIGNIKKINPSLIINCTDAAVYLDNCAKDYYDLKYIDAQGIGGMGMLIYQAILSVQILTGVKLDLDLFGAVKKQIDKAVKL